LRTSASGEGVVRMREPDLLNMSARELDVLFRASPAGPIPDGDGDGTVLMLTGTPLARLASALAHPLLWQGKVVDGSHGKALNKITPLRLRAVDATVTVGPSWVDGKDCVVIDYSRTSIVARWVRDEIRLVAPGTYLGVVWLGGRRIPGLGFVLRFTSARQFERQNSEGR
jgi:hypothetical protein